jgi:mycothiol synthase
MSLTRRPLTADDADRLADLMMRIEADHMTGFCLSAPEFVEIVEDMPTASHEGAWDGDDLVAYTTVIPSEPTESEQRFILFGDVAPDRMGQGIGTEMVAGSLERSRRHRDSVAPGVPIRVTATAYAGRDDQADLLASAGMTAGRHSYRMVARLAERLPGTDLPDDLEVSSADPVDSEELRQVHNAVFADYPDGSPADAGFWNTFMVTARHNRHDISVVARDAGGEVAGYVFAQEYAVPVAGPVGREIYLPYLGTVAAQRGRGIAPALLGRVIDRARDAGYDAVTLDVDTENPTGALKIYQEAGFVQVGRRDFFHLVEPA